MIWREDLLYAKCLKENKELKVLINKDTNHSPEEVSDSTEDEEILAKYKSNGYKQTNPQNNAQAHLKCTVCKRTFFKEKVLRNHMASHNEDGDWTCGDFECNFQTNSEDKLTAHKHKEHEPAIRTQNTGAGTGNGKPNSTDCNTCGKEFIYKIDLNKHISDIHMTYKPCRNAQTCTYAPRCRYNHKEYPQGHQVCYECGKSFKSMHELMKHRKSTHKVPMCKQFMKNNCGFSAKDCYNNHSKASEPATSVGKTAPEGFWEVPQDTAPPVRIQKGPTQAEWLQMKQALVQLNKMMQQFQ